MHPIFAVTAAAAALSAPTLAQSTPDVFDFDVIPQFRGTGSAVYAGWDAFTTAFGGVNMPDDLASSLSSSVEQIVPGAIVTTTMNIYHPGAASSFVLDSTSTDPVREAVLQVRSFASPLDDATFRLAFDRGGLVVELAPSLAQLLSPVGAGAEEKLFAFDLTGVPEEVRSFRVLFDATAAHCSFDAVMLDVRTHGEVGTGFCSAVPNSTGAAGALTAWGSELVADNEFELRASSLPVNTFGLYIVSQVQDSVPMAGGSTGTLCLGGQVGRFNTLIFNSGLLGENATSIDLTQIPTPQGPTAVAAGDTWNFQCWHRDANPTATSNFTAPVSVTFQ